MLLYKIQNFAIKNIGKEKEGVCCDHRTPLKVKLEWSWKGKHDCILQPVGSSSFGVGLLRLIPIL